jgi:2-polyprenyl-3-methyl-5-hydroxy-6-metoxy-1,4-benzoquinol methylase
MKLTERKERRAVKYWRDPEDKNSPHAYANSRNKEKCELMADLVGKYAKKDSKILDIGCNCGMTLDCLFQRGYNNLYGVDINAKAIILAKKLYPHMVRDYFLVSMDIKEYTKVCPDKPFDIIYTSAVLVHIPYMYDDIFPEIARMLKANGYLILREDEKESCSRKFPRNYKVIFENLGLIQIDSFLFELNKGYIVRIFKRKTSELFCKIDSQICPYNQSGVCESLDDCDTTLIKVGRSQPVVSLGDIL